MKYQDYVIKNDTFIGILRICITNSPKLHYIRMEQIVQLITINTMLTVPIFNGNKQ
jgi:hypothetical protein